MHSIATYPSVNKYTPIDCPHLSCRDTESSDDNDNFVFLFVGRNTERWSNRLIRIANSSVDFESGRMLYFDMQFGWHLIYQIISDILVSWYAIGNFSRLQVEYRDSRSRHRRLPDTSPIPRYSYPSHPHGTLGMGYKFTPNRCRPRLLHFFCQPGPWRCSPP